jgi:hypothetical protein
MGSLDAAPLGHAPLRGVRLLARPPQLVVTSAALILLPWQPLSEIATIPTTPQIAIKTSVRRPMRFMDHLSRAKILLATGDGGGIERGGSPDACRPGEPADHERNPCDEERHLQSRQRPIVTHAELQSSDRSEQDVFHQLTNS